MTFRAEDKVRYLFLIGLQEEGREGDVHLLVCHTFIAGAH